MIEGDDYRVYLFNLSELRADELGFYCERLLSVTERERAKRYKSFKCFRQFVAGRALLRTVLTHLEGTPPEDWEFSFGPNGKPQVSKPTGSDLLFNLSHRDHLVGLVVGRAPKCTRTSFLGLGVDLERTPTGELNLDLVKGFFTGKEHSYILDGPQKEMCLRFAEVWSAKEALLKAKGLGLHHLTPLSTAHIDPPHTASHLSGGDDFKILIHHVETDYILALCVPQDCRNIRYLSLNSALHSADDIALGASNFII